MAFTLAGCKFRSLFAIVTFTAGLVAGPVRAAIPEPDTVVFGRVFRNNQPVSGVTVSLRRANEEIDSYVIGSLPVAGAYYIVRAHLFSPTAAGEPRPAKSAFVGDTVTVLVDGVVKGQMPTDRGTVTQLDISTDGTPPPTLTFTPTNGVSPATSTATRTPTGGSRTPTVTGTATAISDPTTGIVTITPTPTITPLPQECVGDCNGDGSVLVNELILGVNIALSGNPPTSCPSFDENRDGHVLIAELIRAVNNALSGCPTPSPLVGLSD